MKARTKHFGFSTRSRTSPRLFHIFISTGRGLSNLVAPGDRRTLRSIAIQGTQKMKSTQVILVRTDSTSANSSSSSSASSKLTPRLSDGGGSGTKGQRSSRGSNGSRDGDGGDTGDTSDGHIGAGHDRINRRHASTVKSAATAGEDKSSCRRHRSSSGRGRNSGRIACSGGEGDDNGSRTEHEGGCDGGKDWVGDAGDGPQNSRGSSSRGNVIIARAIGVRRRVEPMLPFHLFWGIVVRSRRWARKMHRPSATKA